MLGTAPGRRGSTRWRRRAGLFAPLLTMAVLPGATVPPDTTAPTTTLPPPFVFFGASDDSGDTPNPGALFSRRPGAKFDDVELAPRERWHVGPGRIRLDTAVIVAPEQVPEVAAVLAERYATAGLLEAFSPRLDDDSAFLRVELVATLDLQWAACVATSAADGAVSLPRTERPIATVDESVDELPNSDQATARRTFYFPIGQRRGAFYVTCVAAELLGLPLPPDSRGVWRVEV